MSIQDAKKRAIPKPGERGGPPVGWRTPSKWNKERVGITKESRELIKQHKEKMEKSSISNLYSSSAPPSSTGGKETVSQSSGGGKIRAGKISRTHESRSIEP